MSSSVGNGMVGGTVADLFRAKQRGLAMNVFAVLNFIGGVRRLQTGVPYMLTGRHLGAS